MQAELITQFIPEGTFFTFEEGLELSNLSKEKLSTLLEKALGDGSVGMADERTYYTGTYDDYFKKYYAPSFEKAIAYNLKRYNGYISDSLAFNLMHLTTQVPVYYTLAGQNPFPDNKHYFTFKNENYILRQSRLVPKNQFDWKLLRFLDALEYFDNVQDVSDWVLYLRLSAEFKQFSQEEKQCLIEYSKVYPLEAQERLKIVMSKTV